MEKYTTERPFTFKDLEEVVRKTVEEMEKPKPIVYCTNVHFEEKLKEMERNAMEKYK